uniref:Uncharacterized protein n=1 Tax=Strongyloides venezuelensis TaxID=75913 RepID=A0A0K0ETX3_STRVS
MVQWKFKNINHSFSSSFYNCVLKILLFLVHSIILKSIINILLFYFFK